MKEYVEILKDLFMQHIGDNSILAIKNNLSDSPLVTVSGGVCSGKTQLTKKISQVFKFEIYDLGSEFRKVASRKRMSIEDFVGYLSNHPQEALHYDISASYEAIKTIGSWNKNNRGIVAEGQLTGWYGTFLKSLGRENVFKMYLECDLETRIQREMKRSCTSKKGAREKLRREELDRLRWQQEFGIRVDVSSIYDLVINTSNLSLEEVVKRGVIFVERFKNC